VTSHALWSAATCRRFLSCSGHRPHINRSPAVSAAQKKAATSRRTPKGRAAFFLAADIGRTSTGRRPFPQGKRKRRRVAALQRGSPLSILLRTSAAHQPVAGRFRGAKESGDESPQSKGARRFLSCSGHRPHINRSPAVSAAQKKAATSRRTPKGPAACFLASTSMPLTSQAPVPHGTLWASGPGWGFLRQEASAVNGAMPSAVWGVSKRMALAMARASSRVYCPSSILSARTRAICLRAKTALPYVHSTQ